MALLLAAVLLGFSIAVSVNLGRGRDIDCGCFSPAAPRRITWLTVGRNLVLAAAALTIVWGAPTGLAVDSFVFDRGPTAVTHQEALAVGVAVTAALGALAVLRYVPRVHRRAVLFERGVQGS